MRNNMRRSSGAIIEPLEKLCLFSPVVALATDSVEPDSEVHWTWADVSATQFNGATFLALQEHVHDQAFDSSTTTLYRSNGTFLSTRDIGSIEGATHFS